VSLTGKATSGRRGSGVRPSIGGIASRLLLSIVSAGLALVLCELLLRVFWCNQPFGYERQNRQFLCPNKYWGVWHCANNSVEHSRTCFDARYSTNEFGMKGDAVRSGVRKIALLGDSFVEGFGNDNQSTVAHFMQRALGDDYDVLNFGVSGNFSTIDELVLYDDFARFFRPDVAVLFFLNYNDLEDNLDPAKEQLIDRNLQFVYPRAKSLEDVESDIRDQTCRPIEERIDKRLCLSRLWDFAQLTFRIRMQMLLNLRLDIRTELARPYLPVEDDEIRRAWSIVEAALARLNEITHAEGTALVVVDIADPYQIDPNWVRASSIRLGKTLDPTHPNERLGQICRRLGIPYYDMYPDAKSYISEHHLRFPYLSFSCNRHFSAKGNSLMADLVLKYLVANRLVAH